MTGKIVVRNCDVRRILVAPPRGHKHVRAVIELVDGTYIVLQEATVANLVRAYVTVLTHPQRRAVELVQVRLGEGERKEGFAEYQLLETTRPDSEVIEEVTRVLYSGDDATRG